MKLTIENLNRVKQCRLEGKSWNECRQQLKEDGVQVRVVNLIDRCRRYGRILQNGRLRYELWCAPDKSKSRRPTKRTGQTVSHSKQRALAHLPSRPMDGTRNVANREVDAITLKNDSGASGEEPILPVADSAPTSPVSGQVERFDLDATGVTVGGQESSETETPEFPEKPSDQPSFRVDKLAETPASTPTQTGTQPAGEKPSQPVIPGVIGPILPKAERDAIRARLLAGQAEAQRKLDEKKATEERIRKQQEENHAEMAQIGKDITLKMINRVALPERITMRPQVESRKAETKSG